MQPQGTGVVNAAYFEQLTADINAVNACADLQLLVNAAFATLQAEVGAIEGQLAALLPIITLPTDLGSVISWISNFANPLIKPYLAYAQQLTQTLAAISALATAIENAANRLTHCSITVPTISLAALPL